VDKKLVIFDLDGVLTDACEWHRIALNMALEEIAGLSITLEDHHTTFNGIPTKKKLSILADQGAVDKKDFDTIFSLKQKNTIKLINEQASHRPEKVEMVEELRKRGIHVACFTNSIRETAELMLRKTGILHMLESVVTNEDVVNPKPDPEGYLRLVEEFNVLKKNVIIVEDSPKGLQAAWNSGCRVIQVKDPNEVSISLFKDIINK
jgi:HAD superfamily hydrolase (TIGR01509 family)